MNIKEACEVIQTFAGKYGIDEFTAVEVLVKNMRVLDESEREALFTFMDYGRKRS